MKEGDRIRVQFYMKQHPTHTEDFTVEKFRHCLGIFLSADHRKAQNFTPLCDLYEPAPNAEKGYIGNYGEYYTEYVQAFMNLPSDNPTQQESE